jgi:hypothetical protein
MTLLALSVIRCDALFWSLSGRSGHCSVLAHIANSGIFPAQSLKQGTKCRNSTTSGLTRKARWRLGMLESSYRIAEAARLELRRLKRVQERKAARAAGLPFDPPGGYPGRRRRRTLSALSTSVP